MSRKVGLGVDVLTAAQARISFAFDNFEKIYVSFSGGKDSTVMLHLVMDEAIRRGRRVGVFFVDLEAQYTLTIDHVEACYKMYSGFIDPYWIALPISLRNAVSQFEPKWTCWDTADEARWVRRPAPSSITNVDYFSWFRKGMEFEELIVEFGNWYSEGKTTCCFVGIRADESLNRFRTLMMDKQRFDNRPWTTWVGGGSYNAYPIYDWKTADLWAWTARDGRSYNRIYDRMSMAGLTIHQMRICQPYGDDQRKGLWLYHVMEPSTWPAVVARVAGANQGAMYAHESGSMSGRTRVALPPGHTWESYTGLLLATMPERQREHYEAKIAVFIRWYAARGYPNGIPDKDDPKLEASKKVPTWRRICRVILKNDWWCKGLSFSATKSQSYERYMRVMKNRRATCRMQ